MSQVRDAWPAAVQPPFRRFLVLGLPNMPRRRTCGISVPNGAREPGSAPAATRCHPCCVPAHSSLRILPSTASRCASRPSRPGSRCAASQKDDRRVLSRHSVLPAPRIVSPFLRRTGGRRGRARRRLGARRASRDPASGRRPAPDAAVHPAAPPDGGGDLAAVNRFGLVAAPFRGGSAPFRPRWRCGRRAPASSRAKNSLEKALFHMPPTSGAYSQGHKFSTPFNAVRCCRRGLTLSILGQGTARISTPGQNTMSATIEPKPLILYEVCVLPIILFHASLCSYAMAGSSLSRAT